MGLRYRKSINLGGGFRVNISNSGISYSWGTKGYRVTRTARGTTRRTVSIPGTGISYSNETGRSKGRVPSKHPQQDKPPIDSNHYDTEEIANGLASEMVSDGLEDILSAAGQALKLNKISNIGIIISLILSASNALFALLLVGFIVLKIYVRTTGVIDLDYAIDEEQMDIIDRRMEPMFAVADSDKVWRIMQSSKVIDKKYAAGASSTVKRNACKTAKTPPFPFKANIPAASFKTGKETLVFMPDKLFLMQGCKIGALNYSDISFYTHSTRFIESERVPKDARIIDRTWRYVNKSGSPDKRFKNNRELPICLYGEIELKSDHGLNTVIMFSNSSISNIDLQ